MGDVPTRIWFDNASSMVASIHSVYPDTEARLCVIHQIRDSLKYVSWKDKKAFTRDLKLVYRASQQGVS